MVSERHLDFLNLAMEEGVKKYLDKFYTKRCFGAANYFANPQLSVWKYHGTMMALPPIRPLANAVRLLLTEFVARTLV